MEFLKLINTNHSDTIENCLDVYLKNKSTDCILYSQDGGEFKIHKELFSQSSFLREILSSTKEHCCGTLEILCPCTKEELEKIVHLIQCIILFINYPFQRKLASMYMSFSYIM